MHSTTELLPPLHHSKSQFLSGLPQLLCSAFCACHKHAQFSCESGIWTTWVLNLCLIPTVFVLLGPPLYVSRCFTVLELRTLVPLAGNAEGVPPWFSAASALGMDKTLGTKKPQNHNSYPFHVEFSKTELSPSFCLFWMLYGVYFYSSFYNCHLFSVHMTVSLLWRQSNPALKLSF